MTELNVPLTKDELLRLWKLDCLRMGRLHSVAADGIATWRVLLTSVNISSSIIVLFLHSNKDTVTFINNVFHGVGNVLGVHPEFSAEVFTGIFAAVVVASGAIQFFVRYEERHLEHRNISYDFFNLAKKIDRIRGRGEPTDEMVHTINKQLNYIRKYSPTISRHHWKFGDDIQAEIDLLERR